MIKNNTQNKFLLFNIIPTIIFFYALGPIRDDWSNLSRLRDIPFNINGIQNIVTNEWCCTHEKRFFFISWLVQWPMARLGELSFIAVYVLCTLILLRLNWNVYQILLSCRIDVNSAILISGMFGWSAGSVIIGAWANNIFFTLPLLLLSELIKNLWFSAKSSPVKIGLLIFLCEFSGESTLGLLFAVVITNLYIKIKKKEKLFLPIFYLGQFILAGLISYYTSSAPKRLSHQIDLEVFRDYFITLTIQHFRLWNTNSQAYGIENRNLFLLTIFVVLLLLNLLFLVSITNRSLPQIISPIKELSNLKILIAVLIISIGILFPMILGVIGGSRTGPDYRYHLPLFMSVILVISYLYIKFGYPKYIALIIIYCIVTTSFAASLEVRVRAKSLDQQIWQKIDSLENFEKLDGFVTFSPYTNYPMPPYHSFAESDFQADWGIYGKYKWLTNRQVPIYSNLVCSENNSCKAVDYYGKQFDILNFKSKNFAYIYTNLLIDEPSLSINDFKVTSDYESFHNFTRLHPKPLA